MAYLFVLLLVICFTAYSQEVASKTLFVCTCDDVDGFTIIDCPRFTRIKMLKAYTYDDITHNIYNNCSNTGPSKYTMFIRDMVFNQCNNRRNCTIPNNSLQDIYLNFIFNLTCPSSFFEWKCVSIFPNENIEPEYKNQPFELTYFIYIVIAFCFSVIVLVVSVIIVKRCNLRRANQTRIHRNLLGIWAISDSSRNNTETNSNPPPSYDNVYNSSDSVNILPSYTTAIYLKSVENPFFKITTTETRTENNTPTELPSSTTTTTTNNTNNDVNHQEIQIIEGEEKNDESTTSNTQRI